jgi:uncharacterized protein (DUF2249 family)
MAPLAPHDPLPLLAQLEQRWSGRFKVQYLGHGPENWRVRFIRAQVGQQVDWVDGPGCVSHVAASGRAVHQRSGRGEQLARLEPGLQA